VVGASHHNFLSHPEVALREIRAFIEAIDKGTRLNAYAAD